jgi:hypothetical protein
MSQTRNYMCVPQPDSGSANRTGGRTASQHFGPSTFGRWGFAALLLVLATDLVPMSSLAADLVPVAVPASEPNFISSWLDMVTRSQAAQPHWVTPLAVTTPRLEQEYRFDTFSTNQGNGTHVNNYGGTKGLEFIPTYDTEVIVGVPGWIDERTPRGREIQGWGDMSLLLKYRFLSANEEQGNYIFTGFLQLSVPTGANMISNDLYIVQPTLAFGKGWGNFDILATISQQYPVASIGDSPKAISNFGDPVLANVVFQYHLLEYFWPELEFNYTYWPNGIHEGLNQVLMTMGVVVGRIPIAGRSNLIIGAGYQTALTSNPVINNNWILTARVTF